MRTLASIFLILGMTLRLSAADDSTIAAHHSALELAGAFANDGFKIRDGIWTGNVGGATRSRIIQVNLYAGNQYWFCFGVASLGKKGSLAIFDETGKALNSDTYTGEANTAAGISPQISGPYYIKIQFPEGEATDCCLLYCYK